MLERIVEWYNEMKLKVLPCEFDIVKNELEMIDNKLYIAYETAKWCDYDEVYIRDVHGDLQSLQLRIMKTKRNVEKLRSNMKSWGDDPMYHRPEKIETNLMIPDEFEIMISRRQNDVLETKQLINEIMDQNFRLLFNIPLKKHTWKSSVVSVTQSIAGSISTMKSLGTLASSNTIDRPSETNVAERDKAIQMTSDSWITLRPVGVPSTYMLGKNYETEEVVRTEEQIALFRPYEEYIDSIILTELQNALRVSLNHIVFEMKNYADRPDAELFEVKLELQPPNLVFFPVLQMTLKKPRGLLQIISTMIANILNMSVMIPMVAQPEGYDGTTPITFESYLMNQSELEEKDKEFMEIEDLQMDIIAISRDGIKAAQKFAESFERFNFLWLNDKKEHLENFVTYGKFLTDEELDQLYSGTLEIPKKSPSLEDFRTAIDYYNELHDEVEKLAVHHVFKSWLRINIKALKYSILNSICKWSYVFKEHLRDKVTNDLLELEFFIDETALLLDQEPTNNDYELLLAILRALNIIQDRERLTDAMFQPLKDIVDILKLYDMPFDERINDLFAELPEKWITLKKFAAMKKQSIAPVQSYQVDLIKKRIILFDLKTKLYHEKFMKLPFFNVPCSRNVYELCDFVNNEITDMNDQYNNLRESSFHFQLIPPDDTKLMQCKRLARMMKHIWDFMYAVSSCIDDWKKTAWKKINVDDMETECKRFAKDMRNFDKEMKNLKPYTETEAMIKNLLTSLRAIIELQNPAIRERHWVELMNATKVSFSLIVIFIMLMLPSLITKKKNH